MRMDMKKISSLLAGIVIFAGLPVLGWGPGDIGGFVGNPFRLTYLVIMIVLSVLVVVFVPNEGRGYGEGKKIVRKHKLSLHFFQVIPAIMILISPYFDKKRLWTFNENSGIRMLGLTVVLLGYLIMNWSILVLGRQFSVDVTIQEGHRLVTSGPYRYIRHPRYLGIILFLTGIPIVFLALMPLLMVPILIGVLLWRISDEEEIMHGEFGREWEEYRERTFSLLPFVY